MSEPTPERGPGCGLAVYAIFLGAVFLVALGVMILSTVGMVLGTRDPAVSELVPGREVQVWRLQPLVQAGVLPPGEVPVAWHDESGAFDGSVACALLADRLVRVDGGVGTSLRFAEARGVTTEPRGEGLAVTLEGEGASVTCTFGQGDGGERLARQLAAELGR